MKAILIARVSTEEQRDAGNSLPAQVTRLENYCRNKGFEILKVCSFDESAYKTQRDEFDSIIDFILSQKEKIAVCCDKVDRLSRNIFDKRVAQLYEKALCDEIELHFTSEGQVLTSRVSAVEKFQFSMSLGLAKYYSDAISDNVRRAQETKVRKGEWLSKAPFGYKNIRLANGSPDIVVDEHNASIVRTVFELYATGAYSTELLCKKIKADFGLAWPKGYLGKMLSNPFYHGFMIVKEKVYQHRYPSIISQAVFGQVQQVKNGFKKKPFKYAGLPFFYRGIVRCTDCDCSVSPDRKKGFVYYSCTEYKGKHGAKWMREEALTEQFAQVFKSLQVPPDTYEPIVQCLQELHESKIEFHNYHLEKLLQEQKTLIKMMDSLYLDKLKGKITDEKYDEFYERFVNQKNDIEIKLSNLSEAENNYYITAKYVLELTNRAYDLFMSSEVEERRKLINLVLPNVRLNGKNIDYDAQKPFDMMIKSAHSNLWRS